MAPKNAKIRAKMTQAYVEPGFEQNPTPMKCMGLDLTT